MYLSMSEQLSAAGGSLEYTNLYFAPHFNQNTGITAAFNSVDVCFRADNQINVYYSVLLSNNPVLLSLSYIWVPSLAS